MTLPPEANGERKVVDSEEVVLREEEEKARVRFELEVRDEEVGADDANMRPWRATVDAVAVAVATSIDFISEIGRAHV